jgi:chemotaxis protein CheC
MTHDPFLRPDELELLQEIMNIAFGQAAADLAEMVDIFVVLSIPEVRLVPASELPAFLATAMADHDRISLVEQEFWGQFKGHGYLVLPSGATRELVSLLGNTDLEGSPGLPLKELEMETLQEVGNILIGACVGKLAELLEDTVHYCPPTVAQEFVQGEALSQSLWVPGTTAIVLKTLFRFSGRNVSGLLFLVTSEDSLQWLRKALAGFLGRYA